MLAYTEHSRVFKTLGVVLVAAVLVFGVIAGFVFATPEEPLLSLYGSGRVSSDTEFNWILMLLIWFSSIVPIVALYAVYSHLDNQETMMRIMLEIEKNSGKSLSAQKKVSSSFAAMDKNNRTWKCSLCGATNMLSDAACKKCGHKNDGM